MRAHFRSYIGRFSFDKARFTIGGLSVSINRIVLLVKNNNFDVFLIGVFFIIILSRVLHVI